MQTLERTIPMSGVALSSLERDYLLDAFDSGWISGVGPYVARFEQAVSTWIDRPHVVACTNGTVALETVLRALNVGPGDEVIVPALTFAACAAVVKHVGATLVFADVHPETWTIDPDSVFRNVTPRTKAVIAVDLIGHPADYEALRKLDAYGIYLIEDAAEAHGALYKGAPVGSFGVAATFSFFGNKSLSSGEGGCILTHHAQLAERMRVYINHGVRLGRAYDHIAVGTNYRLTALHAAIGTAQVERRDELLGARTQVGQWYDRYLPDGFTRRPVASWATEGMWLYTVTHPQRDRVMAHLKAHGVDSRPMFPVLPRLQPYYDRNPYPVSERLSAEGLMLPTSATMTEDDVQYVCQVLSEAA